MSEGRLRLAAHLRGTCAPAPGPSADASDAFLDWLRGVEDVGARATVVLGLAVSRLLHPFWGQVPLGGAPGEALAAAEAAFRCPCAHHAREAADAGRRAEDVADAPDLTDGPVASGAPPPLWANAEASFAVAAARVAGFTAWAASRCPHPEPHGVFLRGLAVHVAAAVPPACHDAVRAFLCRALLPWALGATGAIEEPAGADALRGELVAAFVARAAAEGDPVLAAARAQAEAAHTLRDRMVAAYAGLLAQCAAPGVSGEEAVRAFYDPSFHRACAVGVTLGAGDADGALTVLGFDATWSPRGATVDFLLSACFPGEASRAPSPATWVVRHALARGRIVELRGLLDALDPWTIEDAEGPGGRDGITCAGEVLAPGRDPHRFLTWTPWSIGAERQARYLDALLELALATVRDPFARQVLEDVAGYRR